MIVFCVGSRDNISAVVVPLAAAQYGPSENGGVARLREQRAGQPQSGLVKPE